MWSFIATLILGSLRAVPALEKAFEQLLSLEKKINETAALARKSEKLDALDRRVAILRSPSPTAEQQQEIDGHPRFSAAFRAAPEFAIDCMRTIIDLEYELERR